MKFKILFLIMGIFSLIACNKYDMTGKEPVYEYGTVAFNEKEKEFAISLAKATDLYKSNTEHKARYALAVIYGDNYIFNYVLLYNLKTGVYTLSGIWVNGYSGEVTQVKTNQYIKISLPEDLSKYYHNF